MFVALAVIRFLPILSTTVTGAVVAGISVVTQSVSLPRDPGSPGDRSLPLNREGHRYRPCGNHKLPVHAGALPRCCLPTLWARLWASIRACLKTTSLLCS